MKEPTTKKEIIALLCKDLDSCREDYRSWRESEDYAWKRQGFGDACYSLMKGAMAASRIAYLERLLTFCDMTPALIEEEIEAQFKKLKEDYDFGEVKP